MEANQQSPLPVDKHHNDMGCWDPPCKGRYKLNCGAAIDKVWKVVGMCIMVRDYDGFVVAASSQRIQGIYSPQVAEAMAIFRGLVLA